MKYLYLHLYLNTIECIWPQAWYICKYPLILIGQFTYQYMTPFQPHHSSPLLTMMYSKSTLFIQTPYKFIYSYLFLNINNLSESTNWFFGRHLSRPTECDKCFLQITYISNLCLFALLKFCSPSLCNLWSWEPNAKSNLKNY